MKHIILIAALSITELLMAGDPGIVITKDLAKNTYYITYEGKQANNVRITIFDSKGNVMIKANYTSIQAFKLPVNFNELNSGKYFVKVSAGENVYKASIDHKKEETPVVFHVTKLKGNTDKFLLSFTTPVTTTLNLTIYNQYSKVIHEMNKEIDHEYATVVNIKDSSGPFIFEVTDANGKRQAIIK